MKAWSYSTISPLTSQSVVYVYSFFYPRNFVFIQGITRMQKLKSNFDLVVCIIHIYSWLARVVMVDYLTSITLVICFLLQYKRGSNSFITYTQMTIYRILKTILFYSFYRDIGNVLRLKACHCIIRILEEKTTTKTRHFHALTS